MAVPEPCSSPEAMLGPPGSTSRQLASMVESFRSLAPFLGAPVGGPHS